MNILYISSKKSWGGVITWMQKTALALENRGHQVFIISHPQSEFTKKSDKRLNLISRKLGFMYNLFTSFWLAKFIKKNGIDLIVANIEKEIVAGGLAARICKIPLLRRVGNQGDFKKALKYRLHHNLFVDYTMTISEFTKKESLKKVNWMDSDKFSVIYHGRNTKKIAQSKIADERVKLGIAKDDFVLGITSRLDKEKGIADVIKAFGLLSSSYREMVLVITGVGEELSSLKKIVQNLRLGEKVIFAGFTSNPLLRAAVYDIALTYTYNEAIPNTLFEYLSVGCVTISSRIGGIPELIEDEVNGILVEEKNPEKLAEKILCLFKNENIRKEISKAALYTIEKKFSEEMMIDNLEILYKKVISG